MSEIFEFVSNNAASSNFIAFKFKMFKEEVMQKLFNK